MNIWLTILLVIAYIFVGVVCFLILLNRFTLEAMHKWPNISHKEPTSDTFVIAGIGGLVWPVAFPIYYFLTRPEKEPEDRGWLARWAREHH